MTKTNWIIYVIASVLWLLMHVVVFLVADDQQRVELDHHFLYIYGLILSVINFFVALFVDWVKEEKED